MIYEGANSREWIHVDDHSKGLLTILYKGKIGESYNITGKILIIII